MALLTLAAGGCASGSREAYFGSRSASVEAKPGDGSTRIALWGTGVAQRGALASLDRPAGAAALSEGLLRDLPGQTAAGSSR